MLRSILAWIATNPEEAAGLLAAFVALVNALAFAAEKRLPKVAGVLRSLVPFIVGAFRAIKRPDASTGPAAPAPVNTVPEKAAAGSYAPAPVPPPVSSGPTKENPTVPPVGPFVLAMALTGCGITSEQVEPHVARLDVAAAAMEGVTKACTNGYRAAKTPEDLARLDAYCPQVATGLDAVKVAAASLRAVAGLAAARATEAAR